MGPSLAFCMPYQQFRTVVNIYTGAYYSKFRVFPIFNIKALLSLSNIKGAYLVLRYCSLYGNAWHKLPTRKSGGQSLGLNSVTAKQHSKHARPGS